MPEYVTITLAKPITFNAFNAITEKFVDIKAHTLAGSKADLQSPGAIEEKKR